MAKVIAISNQKGGVGKTTTTVNIGVGLAEKGYKVLLIDADPQGSLTSSLGNVYPDQLEITLANLLHAVINDKTFEPEWGIIHYMENVDLIPSNIELSAVEVNMGNVLSREMILRDYIEMQNDNYDYILIDCMPSLGLITINALVAADSVLIPIQAAYLSVKGLQQLLYTIGTVRKRLNKKLMIEGILLTMVDYRTNYAKSITESLRNAYGEKVLIFQDVIPASVKMVEASSCGKSIYHYDKRCKVAEGYRKITEEVIKHGL